MVKYFLILFLFLSFDARSDLFDFVSDKDTDSKINSLVANLKKREIKDGPEFEDFFNQTVKSIEYAVEEEKLYCSGEAVNRKGKTLPSGQKQLCMRELKKRYLEATSVVFDIKKKYLALVHERQLKRLSEVHNKLREEIEKNF